MAEIYQGIDRHKQISTLTTESPIGITFRQGRENSLSTDPQTIPSSLFTPSLPFFSTKEGLLKPTSSIISPFTGFSLLLMATPSCLKRKCPFCRQEITEGGQSGTLCQQLH